MFRDSRRTTITRYKNMTTSFVRMLEFINKLFDTNGFTSIEDKNKLFNYFFKLVTFYLNIIDTLRKMTNHGIVVFWCYIGIFILITIHVCRSY